MSNKTNDAVEEQRQTPLKLRACLNDTDVSYFHRFSLVDKMASKCVPKFLCFLICVSNIEYEYYVHRYCSYMNTKIKATLDYAFKRENTEYTYFVQMTVKLYFLTVFQSLVIYLIRDSTAKWERCCDSTLMFNSLKDYHHFILGFNSASIRYNHFQNKL